MDTAQRIDAVRSRLRAMQIDERVAEATGAPCIECRHYQPAPKQRGSYRLKNPTPALCRYIAHTERRFDPVVGSFQERDEMPAATARSDEGLCGPEGLLFEPFPIYQIAFQRFNNSGFAAPAYVTAGIALFSWLFG